MFFRAGLSSHAGCSFPYTTAASASNFTENLFLCHYYIYIYICKECVAVIFRLRFQPLRPCTCTYSSFYKKNGSDSCKQSGTYTALTFGVHICDRCNIERRISSLKKKQYWLGLVLAVLFYEKAIWHFRMPVLDICISCHQSSLCKIWTLLSFYNTYTYTTIY